MLGLFFCLARVQCEETGDEVVNGLPPSSGLLRQKRSDYAHRIRGRRRPCGMARLRRRAARALLSGFESGAIPPRASRRVMNLSIACFVITTSSTLAGGVITAE